MLWWRNIWKEWFKFWYIKETLRKAVCKRNFPVFAGSALKNKGVQLILDAWWTIFRPHRHCRNFRHWSKQWWCGDYKKCIRCRAFSALAFKLRRSICRPAYFFRVYSGTLSAGSYVYNPRTRNKERIGRILRMHANDREEVKKFCRRNSRGGGAQDTITSDTICDENNPIILDRIVFLNRLYLCALNQKPKQTRKRWECINRLAQEDQLSKSAPTKKQARLSLLVWESYTWKL